MYFNIVQSKLGLSHKQCTQLMDGSIRKRWSSQKDALRVVDPLSYKDLVIVVDFHRFTDCHPEAILDVNKRRDLSCNLLHRRREERSSDHRQFLSEPGSARYFSTRPHRHSHQSDLTIRLYSTISLKSISLKRWLYHQMFKLTFQFCSTLLISVTWSVILHFHSDWSIASQLWNTVNMTKYVNINRYQSFIFRKSIMDNRWQQLSFNAKIARGKKASF